MARPRRLANFDYLGVRRYLLTFCTLNRVPHFVERGAVDLVVDQFLLVAAQQAIAIPLYLLMPDHAHLLVEGMDDAADVKRFVKLVKQRSGYKFKRLYLQRLWQDGFNDRVLRDQETTEDVITYIVNNALRKGLVANPADYPYWGSTQYTREEILEFVGYASHRRRV